MKPNWKFYSVQKRPSPAKVSRSLSVPIRNVIILRSGSFQTLKEPLDKNISQGTLHC